MTTRRVLALAALASLMACKTTTTVTEPSAEAPLGTAAALLRPRYASPSTGHERGYLLYLPRGYGDDPDRQWPLLLFLHGNGERGNGADDLDFLLKNGPLFEAWIQRRDLPFVIVAPQLPMYDRAEHADYLKHRTRDEIPVRMADGVPPRAPEFETTSPMLGVLADDELPHGPQGPPQGWPLLEADVLAILDEVEQRYAIDASRRYITGVSYGGFGTWYMASRHPQRFAAMAPVVGYGHPDLMPPLAEAELAVWCFAGGRDPAVPLRYFYTGLNRLEALGHPHVRFTIEADMGHDVWARVYAGRDLYDWLLEARNDGERRVRGPG